ncbi:MAG: DnaA/Hda family protein [Pseudomonadota bacterium]
MTNEAVGGIADKLLAFQSGLRSKYGDTIFQSWMADLDVLEASEDAVTLLTPSAVKRDRLDQVYRRGLHSTWCKLVNPVARLTIALKEQTQESARRQHQKTTQTRSALFLDDNALSNNALSKRGENARGGATATPDDNSEQLNALRNRRPIAADASAGSQKGEDTVAGPLLEDLISPVDARMRFDGFAVDHSNEVAFAAAKRALRDDNAGDLVYIYGPSGCGKTHLLYALANNWSETHPDQPFAYFTYSDMRNGCASAARSSALQSLHQELAERRLILIDDLHLLLSCVRTQEEILNLANRFATHGRQLVIAGEVAPARLKEAGLNPRLADRLSGGLPAPIEVGGESLRREVIMKRRSASKAACAIADDAIDFIVQNFTSSMREAIGAFNQLELLYGAKADTIGADEARAALKTRLKDVQNEPTLDDTLEATAKVFKLSVEDLRGRAQPQRIARARHAFVMVGREALGESFPRLGKALKRDHTTVMSSYDRAQALHEREETFRANVAAIKDRIGF